MRSAEEAVAYLEKLRAMIMYTGVANCRMQEGGFRCDVNLSVREKGAEKFGTRTEMKNLNSFAFIAKAIDYEFKRQCEAIESGEEIVQETRRFDPVSYTHLDVYKRQALRRAACYIQTVLEPAPEMGKGILPGVWKIRGKTYKGNV